MNKRNHIVLAMLISMTGCSGTSPDLGVENGALQPCPDTPNCVNSEATDTKHKIHPFTYMGTSQNAQAKLLQILQSNDQAKIILAQPDYIRVEFTSSLFKFVDDVEFYLEELHTDKKIIQIRSASRLGYSDLGANRKRIEKIRELFDE